MNSPFRPAWVLFAFLLASAAPAFSQESGESTATDQVPSVTVENQILKAFTDEDYERAARLIEAYLESSPGDPNMWYNLACARARLNDGDAATAALRKAIENGFRDFDHMRSDPDLDSIRQHEVYTAIDEATKRARRRWGRRGGSALDRWKSQYSDETYRYEVDETRNIAYATALDEVAHNEMREMLEEEANHLIETLFEAAPPYQVLIAVPSPEDANRVFRGDESIGGIYEHTRRRLISRDIGGSLRHEFLHVLHYGHMHRLKQDHPIWIQEGLATLYEDYEFAPDGSVVFVPNERVRIMQNLVRANRLDDWESIFGMSAERFMSGRRVGRMYPLVRSIFEFLAAQGKLTEWYTTYVQTFDEDSSGALAMEQVFGKPVEEIEGDWRRWLKSRPYVDTTIEYGDASLGIEGAMRGSNDGVSVTRVIPGSAAGHGGVRRGDVIVSIEGKPTRSLGELQRIVATKQVGDTVEVRVRRNTSYVTLVITLRALVAG